MNPLSRNFDFSRKLVESRSAEPNRLLKVLETANIKLRKKIPELQLALEGKVEEHHRFLLSVQLHRTKSIG